jgi:hypothetical protein
LKEKCYYCNGDLNEMGIGLDRLDNTIGYLKNNVVPCCDKCNRLKHTSLSKEETLEVIKLLKKLRNKVNLWN